MYWRIHKTGTGMNDIIPQLKVTEFSVSHIIDAFADGL
jgi:hypothetical protein